MGNQIKENEIGGIYSTHGEMRTYTVLDAKPVGNRLLGRRQRIYLFTYLFASNREKLSNYRRLTQCNTKHEYFTNTEK
jgi:hypothetical protein